MVSGIFCGSVVARINNTCAGGSSNVFNSALKASLVSICTSSIIYTLRFPCDGANRTLSRKSRISSIPRLLAASISNTSRKFSSLIALQLAHWLHGSPSCKSKQFTAFAKILAELVFPVPLGPQNRYACAKRSARIAFFSVVLIWSCPRTSAKVWGRNTRYRAR